MKYIGIIAAMTEEVAAIEKLMQDIKINNIYDMAGNVLEWTTATYSDFCRVIRGGYSSSMASRIGRNANISDNDVRLPCNTLY